MIASIEAGLTEYECPQSDWIGAAEDVDASLFTGRSVLRDFQGSRGWWMRNDLIGRDDSRKEFLLHVVPRSITGLARMA